MFHLELQAIQAARSSKWHDEKVLSFELFGASRRSLEEAGDGRSAEAVIPGRLGSATHVLPRLKRTNGRATLTAEEFRLVGDQVELVHVHERQPTTLHPGRDQGLRRAGAVAPGRGRSHYTDRISPGRRCGRPTRMGPRRRPWSFAACFKRRFRIQMIVSATVSSRRDSPTGQG